MLRQGLGVGAGAVVAGSLGGLVPQSLAAVTQPSGSDPIRVGLIGCGGRGTAAVVDVVAADEHVEVVALGDVFEDHVEGAAQRLRDHGDEKVREAAATVTPETCHAGFDAYKKVCESDADYILIACPPYFHPAFSMAAVEAGKHVFCEKPGAVDAPGLRKLAEAGKKAADQGTGFLSGLQRRHDPTFMESIERIEGGEIGKPMHGLGWWNNNGWLAKGREEGWDEMTWQLKNWRQNRWLSGDCPGVLVIHYIDVLNWALGDTPLNAIGNGGRISNTDPDLYGNIYDHFGAHLEYESGASIHAMTRTLPGDAPHMARLVGTEGECALGTMLRGADGRRINLRRAGEGKPGATVLEHVAMLKSIRDGEPINECQYLVDATLTTLMMRETAYTGRKVSREFMLNESERLTGPDKEPDELEFGDHEIEPVAVPGKYELK